MPTELKFVSDVLPPLITTQVKFQDKFSQKNDPQSSSTGTQNVSPMKFSVINDRGNDISNSGRRKTQLGPRKSCWGVSTPLTKDQPLLPLRSHMAIAQFLPGNNTLQISHMASMGSDSSHITRWKEILNNLNVPKKRAYFLAC